MLAQLPETGSAEVKATARALNQLSTRLKTAMESRMRLVAAAGHDLRTPMTRMRLRAEFLDDERDKWLHDLDELDRIADSAIRLVREEVDQDAVEPVDLERLVRDIEAEMVSLGHAVSIGHLDTVSVRAGALGLRRALRNLIVNAATHGKGVQRRPCASAGKRAVLTISDHGPGIPPELPEQGVRALLPRRPRPPAIRPRRRAGPRHRQGNHRALRRHRDAGKPQGRRAGTDGRVRGRCLMHVAQKWPQF